MKNLRHLLSAALMVVATSAAANFHTFRIQELYSNADGTIQYVVLQESQLMSGEHVWEGHDLTSTRKDGRATVLTFANNLASADTAHRYALVATKGFSALGLVTPDYIMPDGFLPIGGGDVNFADVDDIQFASL